MRRLAAILLLALAAPAGAEQRSPQPPPPPPSPGPVRIEPDWAAVRAAQQGGQVQSVETLQRALRQQQPGVRPGDLIGKLGGFISQAQRTNAAVMIPLSAAQAETTALVTGKTFYSFSATFADGRTASVLGMCSGIRLPDDHPIVRSMRAATPSRPVLERLGEPYQIGPTEGGNQLSFSKFGCAYEVELVCTATCSPESELPAIANSLALINAR